MNQEEYRKKFYEKKSPLQAIKMKCWDCCGGSYDEAKKCTCSDTCVLYPFRMGKNPFTVKREMTEEQRKQAVERLEKARLKRNGG